MTGLGNARHDFYTETLQGHKQRCNKDGQSDKSRVSQTHKRLPEGQVAQTEDELTHRVKHTDMAGEHTLETEMNQINK